MAVGSGRIYAFGGFDLYPEEALLLHSGKQVSLTPKTFKLLCVLVESRGHLVDKDALMRSVWPDSFVEESNLTYNISVLRKTLSKEGADGEYIETVPRAGYRFIAPVVEKTGKSGNELPLWHSTPANVAVNHKEEEERKSNKTQTIAEPASHRAVTSIPRKRWIEDRKILVYALLAVGLGIGFVGLRWYETASAAPQTLAVLPFRNLKPNPDSDFLSYSLADAIINRLGYLSKLVVRPSSYVAKYRDGTTDPRSVAQELHVRSVLTGNYVKNGDRLLVSVELIDGRRGRVLWREDFSIPYDHLATIQDRVAENVIRVLRVQMMPQEDKRLQQSAPKNSLAYEYYLRAADLGVRDNFGPGIPLLEKAIALEPDFASAYSMLGTHYAAYGAFQEGGDEYIAKSKAAYEKALELLPDQPRLHSMIATQMIESGDLEDAVSSLREELEFDPNEPLTHFLLSEAYRYAGMLAESTAEAEHALQLDPLIKRGISFNNYLYAGEYKRFFETLPTEEGARTTFYRGLCLFYMNDFSKASLEFEHAYQLDPSLLHAKYGQALLFALRKQKAEGIAYLRDVEFKNPTRDGEMLYKVAEIYAVLGDKQSSLRALRQAMDRNFYCYSCFVRDPLLASLRDEREYMELMGVAKERQNLFRQKYFGNN